MILTKKKKAQKIIIDGQKNRGQACRQGRGAEGSPTLNNQLPVGSEVAGRARGVKNPVHAASQITSASLVQDW